MPSAMNAPLAVPCSTSPAATASTPVSEPTSSAVPELLPTARRQAGRSAPLNLTISGSVARPREAFSAKEYVT